MRSLEQMALGSMLEAQKVAPALAFPDEDASVKPGGFKVSTKVLKLMGKEANINTGDVLFKRVRDAVAEIPYNDLPAFFGKKEMSDAQDFIAGKPRAAFNKWLELLARHHAKLGKYVREVPDNASLVFYLFSVRVTGKDLTDILFKRYFETDPEHPEAIKAQRAKAKTEGVLGEAKGKLVQPTPKKYAIVSVRGGREVLVKEVDTVEQSNEVWFKVLKNTMDVLKPNDHVMVLYSHGEGDRQVLLSRNKAQFQRDLKQPSAFMKKMIAKTSAKTEGVMTLDDIEAEAAQVRAGARAGATYGHDDRRRLTAGAPNLEAGLRQQAMAAMDGGRMLLSEGRQSTALRESAPPDVLSWLMGRDLQGDIGRNNEAGYIPSAPVLGNRERGRQKDEIDVLGRKQWQHNYASEWDGDTQLWITHRMASRQTGEYNQVMREFAKVLAKAGYKVKTIANKANKVLIDRMYVLYNTDRIKDAERGHSKYLDAMRKGGATRMSEWDAKRRAGDGGVADVGRLLMSLPRQTAPTLESLLEGVMVCIREGEDRLYEALNGKVDTFIQVLVSSLISQDKADTMRELKRGGRPNIYRLGILLQAVDEVRSDVAKVLDHDDPAAIALLRASVSKRFNSNFPPLKKILKQIDAYVATGKLPKLEISKEVRDAIKAEKAAKKAAKTTPMAAEDLLTGIALRSMSEARDSPENIKLMIRHELMGRGWVALTDLARTKDFRGIHFGKIQAAAKAVVKDGKAESKDDDREGMMLKLTGGKTESVMGEGKRDRVKSATAQKTWGGYRVTLGDKDASAFKGDAAVLALLDRTFDYPSSALDAAQQMFPQARVAM